MINIGAGRIIIGAVPQVMLAGSDVIAAGGTVINS